MTPSTSLAPLAVPWSLADAGKAVAAVVAGMVLLLLVVAPVLSAVGLPTAGAVLVGSLVLYALLMGSAWGFGPGRYGARGQALGFRSPEAGSDLLLWPFLVASASVGLALLYHWLASQSGWPALVPPSPPPELVEGPTRQVAGLLLAVVVGPVVEESYFRGFLLPAVAARWGFARGVIATSLFFALLHGSVGLLAHTFASGVLLALLYRRTRCLWSPILAHGLQNALAYGSLLAS